MDALAEAIDYASRGWQVLPVKGKVPFDSKVDDWQNYVTNDPANVPALFDLVEYDGVGVLLGAGSNLVDFDCDSEAAEQTFAELFEGVDVRTPVFQSTRGKHRLFRWSPGLSSKAKFDVDGLEIRTGDKTAQTVFPPSGGRRWLTPPDLPVAEIPAIVIERIQQRLAKPKARAPAISYHAPPTGDDVLNVPRWLNKHGVDVLKYDTTSDGAKRWFIRCPGLASHTTRDGVRDCCVTQEPDGRLGGCCFHASCGMSEWDALRDAIGPLTYEDYHDPPAINHAAVNAIIGQADAPRPKISEFPPECLAVGGTIGRIIEHNLATALCPMPLIALSGALALMSVITGRKVRDKRNLRTNAYYVALAPSSSGKNHARKINSSIVAAVGKPLYLGPSKLKSSSGLVSALVDHPARLFQLDEMSRLLHTMKDPRHAPHLYDIGGVMLEAWGEADTLWMPGAYSDSKRNPVIDQPHLVVYGTAVPGDFWSSLTKANLTDGLLGRMMVFEHEGYPQDNEGESRPVPAELVEDVRAWMQYEPVHPGNLGATSSGLIQYTDEAWERYSDHRRSITQRSGESDTRAGVWRRTAEKTGKLALLSACSRRPPRDGNFPFVEMVDIEWAIKLSNWLTRTLLSKAAKYIAENDHEDTLNRIMRLMPDWTSREKLCRAIRWIRADEREKIIRNAVRDGLIEERSVMHDAGAGRPGTEYRAAYEGDL